jgi:hypothetical protein
MSIIKHNPVTGEMYLTRRDTEFLGLPVGNAFSGAPFKQKNMPFFIAPAIAAVGTAVGVGATIAATAVAIGTVAAVAGTAMTVVGAITGDKGLMKIGAIVGLAGAGVGMIAGGAAAAASGGSFLSGMGGMGSAGIASSQAAAAEVAGLAPNLVAAGITNSELAAGAAEFTASGASTTTTGLNAVVNPASQTMGAAYGITGEGANIAIQAPAPVYTNGVLTSVGSGTAQLGSQLPQTIAAGLAKTAGTSTQAGFFSEMLSGMTPTEKLMTASFGLKAVGGIGDAYNTNQKNKHDQKAEAQRLTNLNAQPTISGLFGYDAKGNKVTSPAQSAQPTASTTSLAPPTLAVPTLTPSGLLAQGVK